MRKHVKKCIDDIYNEVISSSSPDLKRWIDKLNAEVNQEDFQKLFNQCIVKSLTFCISQKIMNEDFFESTLKQNIEYLYKHLSQYKTKMIICVKLRGLENDIYRVMCVPYEIVLADLAYLLLASMRVEGEHLYSVTIDNKHYFGSFHNEEFINSYAMDITIPELGLKVGQNLVLSYDFGEDYIFDIEIEDIEECDSIMTMEDIEVIGGQGYGIWEDQHQLLEMYYKNHQLFLKSMEANGLDNSDFIFEEFDRENHKETIIYEFEYLKNIYEQIEEYE